MTSSQQHSFLVRSGIQIASIYPDLFTFLSGLLMATSVNILTSLIWASDTIYLWWAFLSGILILISSFFCIALTRISNKLWINAGFMKRIPFSGHKDKNIEKVFDELLKTYPNYQKEFAKVSWSVLSISLLFLLGIGTLIIGKNINLVIEAGPASPTTPIIAPSLSQATPTPKFFIDKTSNPIPPTECER